MGLFTFLFGLPLAPLRGFIRLGEMLRDQAEQEMHSTGSARAQLERIAEDRAAGQLTEDEEQQAIREVTQRVVDPVPVTAEVSANTPDRRED